MAKITRQKARKQNRCSRCGNTIEVGQEYLKGTPFRRAPICRCINCGLKSWELSSSEFVLTVGEISTRWEENYSIDTAKDEIYSTLEELRDTAQDSLDNMPEQLQYSENGEMLQGRIDMLEDVLNELDDIHEYEEYLEDAKDELGYEDLDLDENYDDERSEMVNEVVEMAEEAIKQDIEDALCGLDY